MVRIDLGSGKRGGRYARGGWGARREGREAVSVACERVAMGLRAACAAIGRGAGGLAGEGVTGLCGRGHRGVGKRACRGAKPVFSGEG